MKKETLQKAIDKIKELGYQVYVPNDEKVQTYAHYSDGVNIGYIQVDFNCISISTIHKANQLSGTGYQICGGDDAICPENLNKEALEQGFIDVPNWADRRQVNNPPVKFTLDEWLTKEWSGKRSIKV